MPPSIRKTTKILISDLAENPDHNIFKKYFAKEDHIIDIWCDLDLLQIMEQFDLEQDIRSIIFYPTSSKLIPLTEVLKLIEQCHDCLKNFNPILILFSTFSPDNPKLVIDRKINKLLQTDILQHHIRQPFSAEHIAVIKKILEI